jgi:hypothetical protein
MHGLDNKKQCINVISLLLIPLYHAWAGQKNQWINVISLLLLPCMGWPNKILVLCYIIAVDSSLPSNIYVMFIFPHFPLVE